MPSTFSPSLRIELIGAGEQAGSWNVTTNNNLGDLLEQAIAGRTTVDVTSGDVTLTSLNGIVDEARSAVLAVTGTPGVTRVITIPNEKKTYTLLNQTTNTVEVKTASGTAFGCPPLSQSYINCNGSNVMTGRSITDGANIITSSAAPFASPTFTGTTTIANISYSGTLTGGTGVINIGSGQVYKDASGNVMVGTTATRSVGNSFQTATSKQIFTELANLDLTAFTTVLNRNDTNAARIVLGKSRGTTVGSVTAVQNGDNLGQIMFAGADGTTLNPVAAQITAAIDGIPGTNDMPGRLVFSTTADGASTPTERARIDSSGNVGIGTISPLEKLHVSGSVLLGAVGGEGGQISFRNAADNATASTVDVDSSNDLRVYNFLNTNTIFYTNSAERVRITNDGNVGIGTSTPNSKLEVNGRVVAKSAADVNLSVSLFNTASGGKEFQLISSATGGTVGASAFAIRDNTAGVNRASLSTSGNWFFGTTNTSLGPSESRVFIDGNNQSEWSQRTLTLQNQVPGDSNPAIGFHAQGNSVAGILKFYGVGDRFEFRNSIDSAYATVYGASFVNASDYRLKKDVEPSDVGLSAIMALKPVKFKWIDDKNNTEVIGFIADEAQEVLPQSVIGLKDGVNPVSGAPDFQGMKDTVITAVLVKAIQELKAEFDAYKAAHP